MGGIRVMSYSNYPDGMDWGAYDDYHDPELECGHRANDGCDCWCEGGDGDNAHLKDYCTPQNCTLYYCSNCEGEKDESEEYCRECKEE